MDDVLLIEDDGHASITIAIEASPEIVFEESGLQGAPGNNGQPGPPGADIGGYDPGDLTLIFDNQLI